MPKATVTVRELRNKDTGVDLAVTGYRELPGLMRSTYEFQIVVVSNLSCFKMPSHKDTDVVQFTLFKKFPEFEELRAKLHEAFSGMALPLVVKKSIIVNEAVIRDRRNCLDTFMKFISATPRVVTSSHVLSFLGVEANKAKRFASGEVDEVSPSDKEVAAKGETGEQETDDDKKTDEKAVQNLFEEEEEEEGEDFLMSGSQAAAAQATADELFSATDSPDVSAADTLLFDRQDLQRELTEDDEKDFSFVPDAIISKQEVIKVTADDEDDEDDELLFVDDDIDMDKLLMLDAGSKRQQEQQHQHQQPPPPQPQDQPKPPSNKPQMALKPSVPTKPKPACKPTPDKANPKPTIPSKPKTDTLPSPEKTKTVPLQRPTPAPRKLKPQVKDSERKLTEEITGQEVSRSNTAKEDLSSDDIMQYIAANATEEDADLDLFS